MIKTKHRRLPRPSQPHPIYALRGKRVWVAGHRGLAGSAMVRRLQREPCKLLTVNRQEVDLRRQGEVERWMQISKPDVVLIAAGTVGGIHANSTRPAEFIYDNLAIALNIIHTSFEVGIEKLLFLGSSCIYPKYCAQPMVEDQLLTGSLEPTNQWYAMAKLAGLMMAKAYRAQRGMDCITALPSNLYGPGDNFDLGQGHVLAALVRKVHEAKLKGDEVVEIWGTGLPRREFLHVDDLADALVHLITHYSHDEPVNVGSGEDVSIAELAHMISEMVGYQGRFAYNGSMPDGAPRKLLDVRCMTALGWQPRISLSEGLRDFYAGYLKQLPPIVELGVAV